MLPTFSCRQVEDNSSSLQSLLQDSLRETSPAEQKSSTVQEEKTHFTLKKNKSIKLFHNSSLARAERIGPRSFRYELPYNSLSVKDLEPHQVPLPASSLFNIRVFIQLW